MKDYHDNDLVALLNQYYQRERDSMPRGSRQAYNVPRRVQQNLDALKTRRVFPVSFIAREMVLRGIRVLDAGCGTGPSSIVLAREGADVVGIDLDRLALHIARLRAHQERVKASFLEGDVTSLQFGEGAFEVVISHQVLEHVRPEQQVRALQEMWRVLRTGGLLFVQTPNRYFPVDVHDSQLPLAHWVPRKLGSAYARVFGRIPPRVRPMTWTEVVHALQLGPRAPQLINRCDMYHDLADFHEHSTIYTSERSWRSRAYFMEVGPLYVICKMLGVPYAAIGPNLNLLLRK